MNDLTRPAVVQPHPYIWQVELTNYCLYKCLGCPRPGMARKLGFMNLETFHACIQAVREIQKTVRPLGLHHFGESLLHPHLTDFVAYASAQGVPTCLSCNPDRLTDQIGLELLQAGLAKITFSLDGLDDRTLRQIRGQAANYGRAERAILGFIEQRQRLGVGCEVRVQMVAYKINRAQWGPFLEKWRAYPVHAYIKKFDTWTYPELATFGAEPMRHACNAPYESVVVLWEGQVVPCCHDLEGELVMGSISKGLDSVWNGDDYRRFQRQFSERTLPSQHLCRRCAWWAST